ncbi:MAG: hypothetical protein JWO81_92 [Alphaproteobacteria bacterium]|nr:hypothetical protein [Alphaproteobacteria bacterium]
MDRADTETRIYGGLLLGAALLSAFTAAHHPTTAVHALPAVLASLAAQAGLIAGIHGALLLIFVVELVGFYGFARRLGLARPLPAAGMILLGLGTAAMVGAAAINGFAVPAFAARYPNLQPGDAPAVVAMLRMSWALNQALASIGAVAWGGALLAWSAELTLRRGLLRAMGIGGIAIGAVIAGGIASAAIRLDVGGFILVTALMSAWAAGAALLMLSGRLVPR